MQYLHGNCELVELYIMKLIFRIHSVKKLYLMDELDLSQ